MAGRAKAIVLPEPVSATETMSRPLRAYGQAWHWIGVGLSKPCEVSSLMMYGGKPASSKVMMGLMVPRPVTW